jgi:hypothetical protein
MSNNHSNKLHTLHTVTNRLDRHTFRTIYEISFTVFSYYTLHLRKPEHSRFSTVKSKMISITPVT